MIKTVTIFTLGYFSMLCILFFVTIGDEFTPSHFSRWAMPATGLYIAIFLVVYYLITKTKPNEKTK
jgi:hypothetical protein